MVALYVISIEHYDTESKQNFLLYNYSVKLKSLLFFLNSNSVKELSMSYQGQCHQCWENQLVQEWLDLELLYCCRQRVLVRITRKSASSANHKNNIRFRKSLVKFSMHLEIYL